MTYEEARDFITKADRYGIVPGLTIITELLQRLNNPQDRLKVIHIAGTNGKGSTGAFLTSILCATGAKVGRYVSPAVYSYRERIQISRIYHEDSATRNNDDPLIDLEYADIQTDYITKKGVQDTIEKIKPICEQMILDGFAHPTTFEIETAMAFLYLLSEEVDYVILETGMGGRLDATNVMNKPVCTVITSISMDHMQYLGDTLGQIAAEKAGIIKSNCPVVTCNQVPEVIRVLQQKATEMNAPLLIADTSRIGKVEYSLEHSRFSYPKDGEAGEYQISLLGKYQINNAVVAIEAAKTLDRYGHPIDEEAIRWGLYHTRWKGRFEILGMEPYFVIDGAHNKDAALSLQDSIEIYFTNHRLIFIIGVLADKDYQSILSILAPLADTIITMAPDNNRALPSSKLAAEARTYCSKVFDEGDIEHALKRAYAEAGSDDVILAFGSLSFLNSLVNTLSLRKEK